MIDGMVAYACITFVLGLPSYATGWVVLRLFGRNVESISTWWSRTVNRIGGKAPRSAFLKYETEGREVLTAEYAFQVGCLLWIGFFVLLPLGIWFVYSLLTSS